MEKEVIEADGIYLRVRKDFQRGPLKDLARSLTITAEMGGGTA